VDLKPLQWANSKTVGQVSEVAVLAPIKKGRVPGGRQTYEERLRERVKTIETRVEQGIPTELDSVATIHFGRIMVIRPEQYLLDSVDSNVTYEEGYNGVPVPIDDFPPAAAESPQYRTWVLTLVTFDGDLRAYFKDIANFVSLYFDSVFENCEDFPSTTEFEAFWTWIRRYQVAVDLFYPRYRNLSMVRIRQLEAFKHRFDEFVATVRTPTGRRVDHMDDLFDQFLRENLQYGRNFPTPAGTFEEGNG
jgi:hypothetical protein